MKKKIVFLVITFVFIFLFSIDVKASVMDNSNILGDVLSNVSPMESDVTCEYLLGDFSDKSAPAYWIDWGFNLIKYIAVIALLVLVSMDFLKAVASDDKDALKKTSTLAIKRFIYCVLIFFVPIVVEFIMELFGIAGYCKLLGIAGYCKLLGIAGYYMI